ncbi:MAG: aspartyl/asparaginyl beta-hydroxylase domain-containing protein [Steroidobacteraceae bacterium]
MADAVLNTGLDGARELARQQKTDEAERAYAALLDREPEHGEALNYLAMRALQRGGSARARELLERAARHHPDDLPTWMNLGSVREAQGDFEAACEAFRRAAARPPGDPAARLQLGHVLERLGRDGDALLAYFRAITDAQKLGRWLDQETTAPALLERVTHAMRFVKAGRRRAFDQVLEPVMKKHGTAALRRFEECFAIHVGERRGAPDDPRQRPSILYFPGLAAMPYFDRASFPWIEALEDQTARIREELLAAMPQSAQRERVFASDAEERAGLGGSQGAPSWDGFYFFRHGKRRETNHRLCPYTSAVLDALPLVQIREHAPEVMFSVLAPGTHILPHRGVTNTRVVCHLPLVVPPDCALVVGGETHAWEAGRAVVFDDTFEHEAWNRGSSTRVVLILDVWNPGLTPAEQDAIALLVEATAGFNRAAAA